MQSLLASNPVTVRTRYEGFRTGAVSATVHVVVLLAVLGVFNRSRRIAGYKLPGTAAGVTMLAYYNPGSAAHAHGQIPVKKSAPVDPKQTIHAPLAVAKPAEAQPPSAQAGSGSSTQSGLGEGNISIALQKHFPYPTPNLSSLPHGTHGDVILNAVIDEHGKISDLTLLQGLGPAIDDIVIATVRQWDYTPATKNGVPIPSEQELHFHYERS
jgi:protein TonB